MEAVTAAQREGSELKPCGTDALLPEGKVPSEVNGALGHG